MGERGQLEEKIGEGGRHAKEGKEICSAGGDAVAGQRVCWERIEGDDETGL